MASDRASGAAASRRKRGRPAASSGSDTRQRILTMAQRRFGELGYRGLSVEQLARDVGLDARAIYHYFPSKRALFVAASEAAFGDYLADVGSRVLVHDDVRGRLHGFVDLYRSLYVENRHLLSFISVVMIEAMATPRDASAHRSSERPGIGADDLSTAGAPVLAMNLSLAEQAVARGELADSVDRGAATALLQMFGMGLGLASLDPQSPFLPMLDALDLLIDGTLVRP